MAELTKDKIVQNCKDLKKFWRIRDEKFKDWYDLITLYNDLEQEGMESVISNDPRTGYNLGLHILTSSIISHKMDIEGLTREEVAATSYLERFVTNRWKKFNRRARLRGEQSVIRQIAGMMLMTGWYAVWSIVDDESIQLEVWHPAETFPEYGPTGLIRAAHIYDLSPDAARRKKNMMGWTYEKQINTNLTINDYYFYDDDNYVCNATVMGDVLVKPAQREENLIRIPVFTSPVGGLPDKGSIKSKSGKTGEWQKHWGEAIVATNEELTKNYNKMITYGQQLLRDTANPRWFEQSRGDTPILREADIFKRGAIFRGTPEENVSILPTPPIPIELRTQMFDYQNMIQRGLFPWVLHGNVQQQMAGYAMSQVASAAIQVLTPYHEGLEGLLSDLDNYWKDNILEYGYRPDGFKKPKNLPEESEFEVSYNLDIPGYMIQRATVARMLDPNFRISTQKTMDMMFPEIDDPLKEMAKVNRDDALQHPIAQIISLIRSYEEEVKVLTEIGDSESAELYQSAIEGLRQYLNNLVQQPIPQQAQGMAPPQIPREAMPEEEMNA